MGYDITYHPIKETELNQWYFELDFEAMRKGEFQQIETYAAENHLDEHSLQFYKDAVISGAKVEDGKSFEHSHGYFAAVVQGCFKQFFYIRDGAFSFLMQEHPEYRRFTKPWAEITGKTVNNPTINQLDRNYSSGVYIPANMVKQLLVEYQSKERIKTELDRFFSDGRINIFLKALTTASANGDGILEASEIIIPNPINLEESDYYTNLLNCDIEGALLFQRSQQAEYRAIEKREGLKEGEFAKRAKYEITQIPDPKLTAKEKNGFFKRLFG